jgi:hypothetical protein
LRRRFPIFLVLACLLAGVVIHEIGHVVAALCCGGTVCDLTLLSVRPNVRVLGRFSPAQEMFQAAAGSGAVLAVWLLWRVARPTVRIAGETLSCFAAIELLGWALSAMSYPAPDVSRDVSRFLRAAELHPGWVIAGCVLLAAAGLLVARWTRSGTA